MFLIKKNVGLDSFESHFEVFAEQMSGETSSKHDFLFFLDHRQETLQKIRYTEADTVVLFVSNRSGVLSSPRSMANISFLMFTATPNS